MTGPRTIQRRRGNFRAACSLAAMILAGSLWAAAPRDKPTGQETAAEPANVPSGAIVTADGWFLRPPPKGARPTLPEKVTRAFVIPIREDIRQKTYDAVSRKMLRCRAGKAELIVLDMDTWGGELQPALDIARMLKVDLEGIYTVCYVRTRAVSAGALIAMACDEIVISPTGTFGDCAPISLAGPLEGIEREKIETVLRKEFAESAENNGYNVALAEAMVSASREVWLVRNKKTRELRHVLSKDFRGQVEIPPGVSSVPSNPSGQWELLRVVDTEGEILTMHPREAVEYGFASAIVKPGDDDLYGPLMERFAVAAKPTVLVDNWSEHLVGFLTSTAVAGILFFVAILCVYVEMHTPGFGLAGATAVVCFSLLFGSRFLVGMAAWWEIALFVVGVGLILTEVFVTPGFGIIGIAGIFCCIVAMLAMFVPNAPDKLPIPQTQVDWSLFSHGVLAMGLAMVGAMMAAAMVARYLPKVPLAGKLVLAPPGAAAISVMEGPLSGPIQPGAVGVVTAVCRLVGQARFGDRLIEVSSDGAFLPPGTQVTVLKVEGTRIVVRSIS